MKTNIDIVAHDKTGQAFRAARQNLNALGKTGAVLSRTFATMFGTTASLAALVSLTKRAIEYGSSLTDAAVATNTNVEALQALRYAAQEAGASTQQLDNALIRSQKSAQDAVNGLSTAARAFEQLGINTTDFINLPTEEKLTAIGRAMAQSNNKQQAYAAAMDILGTRNAPKLMEVLQRLGADGFDAVAEAARNAGQVMSEETAKAMDDLADKMAKLETRFKTFWAQLTVTTIEGFNPDFFGIDPDKLNRDVEAYAKEIKKLESLKSRSSNPGGIDKIIAERTASMEKLLAHLKAVAPEYGKVDEAANKSTEGVKENTKELLDIIKMLDEIATEGNKTLTEKSEAAAKAIERHKPAMVEAMNANEMMLHSMQRASDGMTTAFMNFVETGKGGLKELLAEFMNTIAAMIFQEQVASPIATMIGGALSRTFTSGSSAWNSGSGNTDFFINHSGGLVGQTRTRSAPAGQFISAPRYHSGGIAGEVPAILQRGEEVLTKDDPRHRNNAQSVNVTFQIQTLDSQSFDTGLAKRKKLIVGMLDEALNKRGRQGVNR